MLHSFYFRYGVWVSWWQHPEPNSALERGGIIRKSVEPCRDRQLPPLYPVGSSQHPTQTRRKTQNLASPADSILFYSNNSVSFLSVFQVHSFVVQLSLQTRSCCTTKYRIVKIWQVCSTFMSKRDGIRIIIPDFEVLWRRSCPQGHGAVRGWRRERAGEEETFEVKW